MDDLTEKVAERCARACSTDTHTTTKGRRYYIDGVWVGAHEPLSPDPHFWFGRLWDRLEEKADKQEVSVSLKSYCGFDIVEWDGEAIATERCNPCLALAAASEALENL